MNDHLPDDVLRALQDALVNVFETRQDLRKAFVSCGVPPQTLARQAWETEAKPRVVAHVLADLGGAASGRQPLAHLLSEMLACADGGRPLWCNESDRRKAEAGRALARLRALADKYDLRAKPKPPAQTAYPRSVGKEPDPSLTQDLRRLKERMTAMFAGQDNHQRGYSFETLLNDLFALSDIEQQGRFKRVGEKIHGAFIHERGEFLLRAGWRDAAATLGDLRGLDEAVGTRPRNTLGLFISAGGFARDALYAYSKVKKPRIICMDGADIICVFDGRIALGELLRKKRQLVSEKALIFAPAADILKTPR